MKCSSLVYSLLIGSIVVTGFAQAPAGSIIDAAPTEDRPKAPPAATRRPGQGRQQPLPPGVVAHRDLDYVGAGHERQKLDLYLPPGEGPFPLVVWIHGGAWRAGSKEGNRAAVLMKSGFATASINYRLSAMATFPAQIEDCKAAIRWLRANASKYHLNVEKIGVWGSSAGGHLVAMLGTTGDVKAFDVGPNLEQSSRVQAVCDYFGPANFLTMGAQGANSRPLPSTDSAESPESQLIGGAVQEHKEKAKAASPVSYVTTDDAPFLIVHGDKDPLVPLAQSVELDEALKKAGVSSTLRVITGGGHGKDFPEAELVTQIDAFFTKHLK